VNEDDLLPAIRNRISNDGTATEARQSHFATQVGTLDLGSLLGALGSVGGDL
jgi:hypothetical protein